MSERIRLPEELAEHNGFVDYGLELAGLAGLAEDAEAANDALRLGKPAKAYSDAHFSTAKGACAPRTGMDRIEQHPPEIVGYDCVLASWPRKMSCALGSSLVAPMIDADHRAS